MTELPDKFRQKSRKLTADDACSAQIVYADKDKCQNDRRIIKLFLQGDQTLGPQAFQIHSERWNHFISSTKRKQAR